MKPLPHPERTDDECGDWIDCWACGGSGEIDGECTCMDDTCCCLYPDPPVCSECRGNGGWPQPAPKSWP